MTNDSDYVDEAGAREILRQFGPTLRGVELPLPAKKKRGRKFWERNELVGYLAREYKLANPQRGVFYNGVTCR